MNLHLRPWCDWCVRLYLCGIIFADIWFMVWFFLPLDIQRIVHNAMLFLVVAGGFIGIFVSERLWHEAHPDGLPYHAMIVRSRQKRFMLLFLWTILRRRRPESRIFRRLVRRIILHDLGLSNLAIITYLAGWALSIVLDSTPVFVATLTVSALALAAQHMQRLIRNEGISANFAPQRANTTSPVER